MSSISATITRSPNCLQLRSSTIIRTRNSHFHTRISTSRNRGGVSNRICRISCVSGGGGGDGVKNSSSSWSNSSFSIDAFSGWAGGSGGGGGGEEVANSNSNSESKPWTGGGMVGAGVAGAVLVAGLIFASLSFKKSTSSPKLRMDPLTTNQEESLAFADRDDTVLEEGYQGDNEKTDSDGSDSKIGGDKESSSDVAINGTSSEDTPGHDTHLGHTSNAGGLVSNSSIEGVQKELSTSDIQVNPIVAPELPELSLPSVENSVDGFDAQTLEFRNEQIDDVNDVKLVDSTVSSLKTTDISANHQEKVSTTDEIGLVSVSLDSSSTSVPVKASEPVSLEVSVSSDLDTVLLPQILQKEDSETVSSFPKQAEFEMKKVQEFSDEKTKSSLGVSNRNVESSRTTSVSTSSFSFTNEQINGGYNSKNWSTENVDLSFGKLSSSTSIPAPSVVSSALQALPGKVLVPAVVDQVQGQALTALQALKVIESDVEPGDLCTRREYARWLVSASSALSRSTISKVYPAMYIENVTELAFDDITPEDPDFSSIQGLAEAGLIASKLSSRDMSLGESSQCFYPESPLSRQDLVSWKMSLEKRQLPVADRKILQQLSGYIDTDKIHPDACPAIVADLTGGEPGVVALAFGYTRLFQPDKPVMKAQAAIALATGEASDIVSEELARIEAESMAEKAVAAHSALVDEVEKDVNANFERDLMLEREKINAVEKMAEEARQEVERLRKEREVENMLLMKERAAVDSEMEVFSKLRHEVQEQLQSLLSNKVELSHEKERLTKLRKDAEIENQEIARLQYELEVERKALSMARAWAEEEAKRAREQAKVLEEARDRWESQGIKVVVDKELREEANAGVTWLSAGKQFSIEGTKSRAEKLVDSLKSMAANIRGKSRETIDKIIHKIVLLISTLKEWASNAGKQLGELKDESVSKVGGSLHGLQQSSAEFSLAVKDGAKRLAGDCREGVERLTQKFKT